MLKERVASVLRALRTVAITSILYKSEFFNDKVPEEKERRIAVNVEASGQDLFGKSVHLRRH